MSSVHGLDISRFDETFLAKSMDRRRAFLSLDSPAAHLKRLAEDHAEAEALFRSLNINHSEFFRETLSLALLEQVILPIIARERDQERPSEIRVWSAGCAAGQEPWTMAILLEELNAGWGSPVPYRIIATDISEEALSRARLGVYDGAAVQNLRLRHLDKYFIRLGDAFSIVPRLCGQVDFSAYDLFDEHSSGPPAGIFGDFDLVLCCNLLFYYRADIRKRILDKLRRCLKPGGYLLTGATERGIVEKAGGFRPVAPPAAVFQKLMRMRG